ncbi:hypothetical protein RHGRI_020077 [Rhododendron griersonianum]|uniref:Uncharacterized protein n=1 Tax=Rhododendron griersonianum TaxID=479676 RepID=A0AAV6JF36_9ERIC|nr:hypothetical protein RHGRI_020077 [Rhododendron griersonianum]
MGKMDGFVSAWPQKVFALHTTHSPIFLGLQQNLGVWLGANYRKEVFIGVLDSGITPDHPLFNDEGMSPPPAKWKGKCDFEGKACNKKLIGARSFVGDNLPPIDDEGHETHTSSMAAGNFVSGANVFGQANGTASGMAPLARLAMYKVGGKSCCDESVVLAAMDAAGVIIGVLDTGITPNYPSFDDEGMPPPPAKWKGQCEFKGMPCNNKLIGARNFVDDDLPPFDYNGHGTHTSSTAAGNFVSSANCFGQANGTASGTVPLAHLAIYKVCGVFECSESSILAGMDAAVEEGVDILSLSIGGPSDHFHSDVISIGAFRAIQKGIFVSCSAGNYGPNKTTLSNEAPWILTVGASTIDRNIRSTAILGNKEKYDGESLFQPSNLPSTLLPLIYAGVNNPNSATCEGSLNNTNVKGKVVLCERSESIDPVDQGQIVKNAGGAAMILMNQEI